MENDYYMIDFQEIKKLLWKKRSLILACAVFFALVFTVASYNRTKSEKELYAAEAAIVVMNSTSSVNNSEDNSINQSEALNTYKTPTLYALQDQQDSYLFLLQSVEKNDGFHHW